MQWVFVFKVKLRNTKNGNDLRAFWGAFRMNPPSTAGQLTAGHFLTVVCPLIFEAILCIEKGVFQQTPLHPVFTLSG